MSAGDLTPSGPDPVGAVILAAGASSRMGRPKALLTLAAGDTFLGRLSETLHAGGCRDVAAVIGYHADLVRLHVEQFRIRVDLVVNREPERGQLSSLLVGLAHLDTRGCQAALVVPVDQPLVTPATVSALLRAWHDTRAAIIRPRRADGRHGHPVLFARRVWEDLRGADLALGARPVVAAWSHDSLEVSVDDEGAYEDVDTPEDYDRLLKGSAD